MSDQSSASAIVLAYATGSGGSTITRGLERHHYLPFEVHPGEVKDIENLLKHRRSKLLIRFPIRQLLFGDTEKPFTPDQIEQRIEAILKVLDSAKNCRLLVLRANGEVIEERYKKRNEGLSPHRHPLEALPGTNLTLAVERESSIAKAFAEAACNRMGSLACDVVDTSFYGEVTLQNRIEDLLNPDEPFLISDYQTAESRRLQDEIEEVAGSPSMSVIISGKAGTGQLLIAKSLHYATKEKLGESFAGGFHIVDAENVRSSSFIREGDEAEEGLERKEFQSGTLLFNNVEELGESDASLRRRFLDYLACRRPGVRIVVAANVPLHELVKRNGFSQISTNRYTNSTIETRTLAQQDEGAICEYIKVQLEQIERREGVTVAPQKEFLNRLLQREWPRNLAGLNESLAQCVRYVQTSQKEALKHIELTDKVVENALPSYIVHSQPGDLARTSVPDTYDQFKQEKKVLEQEFQEKVMQPFEEAFFVRQLYSVDGSRSQLAERWGTTPQNMSRLLKRIPDIDRKLQEYAESQVVQQDGSE